jgi:hypothetical protein
LVSRFRRPVSTPEVASGMGTTGTKTSRSTTEEATACPAPDLPGPTGVGAQRIRGLGFILLRESVLTALTENEGRAEISEAQLSLATGETK